MSMCYTCDGYVDTQTTRGVILRITKKGAEPALQIALKLYLMLLERFRGAHSFTPPLLRLHSLCHTRPCLKLCVMCSEQFRGAALLLNCFVQPFLSHSGLCNLQRIAALKWVDNSGGLAHPLHPPSLAPELHTVVQSHHLCLGCCFLCLLSAIARLRLLLQVLCQVLDAGPLPGPRSPVLPSALLLPASVLGSVGLLPPQRHHF